MARDLGVYLDSDMSMKSHVSRLVGACFGILRQIRSIRRSLPDSTLAMLMSSFIMSKLDYCNVALAGLPRCDLDRLQSVINAAARLTAGARRYDPITPLLIDLHWLRMPQSSVSSFTVVYMGLRRATYKAPSFLSRTRHPVVVCALPRQATSSCHPRVV